MEDRNVGTPSPSRYRTNLDSLFHPQSIAIIGVSKAGNSLGGASYMRKLLESNYDGALYPINPRGGEIYGHGVYENLGTLPQVPDFAIVCIAAAHVPGILHDCAAIGLKHIHILSSGFGELGTPEGMDLERQITSISKENGLMVVGPNCMGTYCPAARLTAWGAIPGFSGPVGIISQSGGITQRLTEYISSLGVGVRKAVSFGNGAVLTAHDYLAYMAEDEKVKVIALYLESIKDGAGLLALTRQISRTKPIVLLKGGESAAGANTVVSHTGSIAGDGSIWNAFARQAGVTKVGSLDEWVDALLIFSLLSEPAGSGVFIAGGGGGNSVTYSDVCVREGLSVPKPSGKTMQRLRELVPTVGSIAGNPLDMFAIFQDAAFLNEILKLTYADPMIHMVIVDRLIPRVIYHLPDVPDSTSSAIDCIVGAEGHKPTIVTLDSDGGDAELAGEGARLRQRFCLAGIPAYPSVGRAARSLRHLHRYYAWRRGGVGSHSRNGAVTGMRALPSR